MNYPTRLEGKGRVYDIDHWIADASYSLERPDDDRVPSGAIQISGGDTDLGPTTQHTRNFILELQDGRWCRFIALPAAEAAHNLTILLLSRLEPPPRPWLNIPHLSTI
ncbi:MAG: hypothetical protein H3C34_16360 [Caldilineaceae bacterium]|nr:hypothetical protein [Caldilineaceae bacterium]